MFEDAKWIWAEDNTRREDRILVRKKFSLERVPKSVVLRIGAADGYRLYVNGKLLVLDGGLPRESTPGNGYYDQLEITRYLVKGDNVLGFACAFCGGEQGGCASAAGLLAESPELRIASDASFEVYRPEGYGSGAAPYPSGKYAGGNVYYDAGKVGDLDKVFDITYGSTLFQPATEYGVYPVAPWNELYPRAIPLLAFDDRFRLRKGARTTVGNSEVYEADFGCAAHAVPILELTAQGTEKIDIRTDRYTVPGGWDDEGAYNNRRIEYVCKNGPQTYVGDIALSGTKFILTVTGPAGPGTVKLNAVSMRRSFYNAYLAAGFSCGDEDAAALIAKCADTLEQCMREDLLDAPDRERGTGLAALSAASRAALYLYDDNVLPLIKKAIIDCAVFSDGAVQSNAGRLNARETPAEALLALSEFGVVAVYWARSGDSELLGKIHGLCARYLLLWETDRDGFVLPRESDPRRYDAGYNVDGEIVETCLYYSACRFVLSTSFDAGETEYAEALSARADAIRKEFEKRYFKGEGYASAGFYDDRANAFAVLSGLADPSHYPALVRLFENVFHAQLQTEAYVLEAMCRAGGCREAFLRLKKRYGRLIADPNPTLPELFASEGGAPCYSGSAAVANVFFGCFAGVREYAGKRVVITPDLAGQKELRFTVPVSGGSVSGVCRKDAKPAYVIENNCPLEVQLNVNGKIIKVPKGKFKYND